MSVHVVRHSAMITKTTSLVDSYGRWVGHVLVVLALAENQLVVVLIHLRNVLLQDIAVTNWR